MALENLGPIILT